MDEGRTFLVAIRDWAGTPVGQIGGASLRLGDRDIDLNDGFIAHGGLRIALTDLERALLAYLVERPGGVIPKATLLTEVWGYHPSTRSRAVDKTVNRLRSKIEADPTHPRWIRTVRGQGYQFVPPEVTSSTPRERFFGRVEERATLRDELRPGRAVSVFGPGGAGKTRLAREHCQGRRDVVSVDLSPARDESAMRQLVAAALGVSPMRVVDTLCLREGLVLLDNADAVVTAVDALVRAWSTRSPRLAMLITARTRVDACHGSIGLGGLSAADAAALFEERAGTTPSTVLLERVDRLPLGIELVAAWSDLASPEELIRRLGVLTSSDAHDPRHHNLDAVVRCSWEALDPEEAESLRRLACFEGGFTLQAADAVLGGDALPMVRRLRNKSMLVRTDPDRFALYELVRSFVAQQPAPADAADRHLAWALRISTTHAAKAGPAELRIEQANLRVALQHALATAHTELDPIAVALAWTLGPAGLAVLDEVPTALRTKAHRACRFHLLVSRGDLAEAEACLGDRDPAEPDVRLDHVWLLFRQRRLAECRVELERAQAAFAVQGDNMHRAQADAVLGVLLHEQGAFNEAAEVLGTAARALLASNEPIRAAGALGNQANALNRASRRGEALLAAEEAWLILSRDGEPRAWARVENTLGMLYLDLGDMDAAQRHLERADSLLREMGDVWALVATLCNLSTVALLRGQVERATAMASEAVLRLQGRSVWARGAAMAKLGMARLFAGETTRAQALLAGACQDVARAAPHDVATSVRAWRAVAEGDGEQLAALALLDDANGHVARAFTELRAS